MNRFGRRFSLSMRRFTLIRDLNDIFEFDQRLEQSELISVLVDVALSKFQWNLVATPRYLIRVLAAEQQSETVDNAKKQKKTAQRKETLLSLFSPLPFSLFLSLSRGNRFITLLCN